MMEATEAAATIAEAGEDEGDVGPSFKLASNEILLQPFL